MKALQTKTAATPAKKNVPFFNKEIGQGFFHNAVNEQTFFSKAKNNYTGIQAKLTIGQPNDIYEKEADAMADKVVQRLSENKSDVTNKNGNTIQTKPVAPLTTITPLVQTKCAECEQEERLQKKEDDDESVQLKGKLQRKPIFESNAEPPDDEKNIQRKCAECEKEEKPQKKEEKKEDEKNLLNGKLQKKPIFESNAEPLDDDKNIQRKCSECEKEDEKKLQTKSENNSPQTVAPSIEKSLNSSKGSGNPLPAATREQMENSFGVDFSQVRIHDNSSAVQMNKDLHAQAFTHGSDIYFNEGKFDAKAENGQKLLAHELAHVEQQKPSKKIQRQPSGASPAPAPGVTPPNSGLPPSTVPQKNAGPSKARLVENEYKGPSIGLPPVDSYDYVFTLAKNKELIEEKPYDKKWDFVDIEATLFKFPTEIGVVLGLSGKVNLGAKFNVSIGPLTLRNVKVGLTREQFWELVPYVGLGLLAGGLPGVGLMEFFLLMRKIKQNRYFGEATLDFQAMIGGGFHFSAGLEADAKFLNVIQLALVKAGIEASADAKVQALADAKVQIEFKNGEMNFNKSFAFESDFLLSLMLKAYLTAKILGWEFDLASIGFQRDFSKELLTFTLGTPFKVSSESGKPKTEFDIPAAIDKIKGVIAILKEATTQEIHGERKEGASLLGSIKPPTDINAASSNLSSYDQSLGIRLADERAGVGIAKFQNFIGSNVASFKYTILRILPPKTPKAEPTYEEIGEGGIEGAPNRRGEHSESVILGKLQALQKAYKNGQFVFKVTHVLSERKPCSACQAYLNQNNPLIKTKGTSVFWLVPYLDKGKDDIPYLSNIRNLIAKYGLTPPTLEAMQEELKPKKPEPGKTK